jgi:hypothetical protein
MMIPGVIDDEDNAPARMGAGVAKLAEELPAGLSVKRTFRLGNAELPVPNPDGSEVTDRLTGGGVEADRILDFRRDPHSTAAAVLLKMDLIHRPKVDAGIASEFSEFFLPPPAIAGRLGLPSVGVCAAGTQTGEITSGSCARSSSLRIVFAEKPKAKDRPKAGPVARNGRDCALTPLRLERDPCRSISTVGPPARRRSIPRTRFARIGGPRFPPSGERPPTFPPPAGSSSPVPQAARRGAGGRTGPRRCDVSRPAGQRSSLRNPKWLMASWARSLDERFIMRNNLCRSV